jgi:hypothetical protein
MNLVGAASRFRVRSINIPPRKVSTAEVIALGICAGCVASKTFNQPKLPSAIIRLSIIRTPVDREQRAFP